MVHEIGLDLAQGGLVDAERFGDTGPKAVDEDIGLLDQSANDLFAPRVFQVERNAFLSLHRADHVVVTEVEDGVTVLSAERQGAIWIAAYRLDFDHPGAEVGE